MKKLASFCLLIFVIFYSCQAYKPFSSLKEKKNARESIKKSFELSKIEYKKIKDDDSILYMISKSMKSNVKHSLTNRRLDSFFVSNYDRKQFLTILLLDYTFPNKKHPFEINKSSDASGFEVKNTDEIKKLLNQGRVRTKVDTIIRIEKKDSTKQKKQ